MKVSGNGVGVGVGVGLGVAVGVGVGGIVGEGVGPGGSGPGHAVRKRSAKVKAGQTRNPDCRGESVRMKVAIWSARRSRSRQCRYRSGRSSGSPASVFSLPCKNGRSVPAREQKLSAQGQNRARLVKVTPR